MAPIPLTVVMMLASAVVEASEFDIDVPAVPAPEAWQEFRVFIWQYRTDAQRDADLYESHGFRAFHIDRGAGQGDRVAWAKQRGWPYYVDHAADKGILHLTSRTGLDDLPRDGSLAARPFSLADPETIQRLKGHLDANIAATRDGPVAAYAFDDEISLGTFNAPIEVDASPASIAAYRRWLKDAYATTDALNQRWGSRYASFDAVEPTSFEGIRPSNNRPPILDWNLAPWMDWRRFNDHQFAACLATLTRHANTLDPSTPAGFVGGQQPAPYGGFDYAQITRAVQWAECYDIGGTNEILRSFWKRDRRPHVQTWFSAGDARVDAWFLWYYLLHGNRGVIAWPDRGGRPWFRPKGRDAVDPVIAANAKTLDEIQGPLSRAILDPEARFEADPIALLYSHPSVQASWALDTTAHGKTWPRRSSSLDNTCQSLGKNRVAWCKLLEDCGYQYEIVDANDVEAGALLDRGYRVLVLGRALALSDATCQAIRRFVEAGGTVIADHLTALLDERGVGRGDRGGLDDLFGLRRDESRGYFDGQTLAEIDGERYRSPFLDRLRHDPARAYRGAPVIERGTTATTGRARDRIGSADVVIERSVGPGLAIYLNLSPVPYYDHHVRLGEPGQAWRDLVSEVLTRAELRPFARVLDRDGRVVPMAEVVRWRRGARLVVGVVLNPTRQGSISSLGAVAGFDREPFDVTLAFDRPLTNVVNLRTGQRLPDGRAIDIRWTPWQALLFETDQPSD